MEPWLILLILAVVQGIAEFLPISSSGHLVILADLIGGKDDLDVNDVNIVLHVGTLLSIIVFYWQRIMRLLGEDRRIIPLLLLGTLPVVAIGLPLKMFADHWLENPFLGGCLLPFTGLILIWASRRKPGELRYQDLGWGKTLLIGTSEAIAVLPGLSRSGTTISAGLRLGLTTQSAATFSFLLAIPAIGGAGTLEVAKLVKDAQWSTPWQLLLMGMFVSFVVGLGSLWWLIRWLEKGKLQYFAYWCIPVGILVAIDNLDHLPELFSFAL